MPTINQLVRKGRQETQEKNVSARSDQLSPASRGLCESLYHHPQETQFRVAEGS